MSLLPLDPLTLADRLGLADPTPAQLAQLEASLEVAAAVLDPRVDVATLTGGEACYTDGCYGIAVRVWDSSGRGLVDVAPDGTGYTLPAPSASTLLALVRGIVGPILTHGGVVSA